MYEYCVADYKLCLCRMWGRLIGAVFYIPAGIMWARGMFSPALKKRVVGMGCLLAFQVIVFLSVVDP